MSNTKFTEEEINWAIEQLRKKYPERANREQAVSYLDTVKSFLRIPISQIEKDKQSGMLKPISTVKKLPKKSN